MHIHLYASGSDTFLPGSVTLTFLRPHLFQVTFDLTEVLDFGLQGFNLNTVETTSRHTKLNMNHKQTVEQILALDLTGWTLLQYLMLNVKFVVFPCLKRLVETSITFYCVIHKN